MTKKQVYDQLGSLINPTLNLKSTGEKLLPFVLIINLNEVEYLLQFVIF